MAEFPQNPRIGQAFLPGDEEVIYVWSGYSWTKGELGAGGGGTSGTSGTSGSGSGTSGSGTSGTSGTSGAAGNS